VTKPLRPTDVLIEGPNRIYVRAETSSCKIFAYIMKPSCAIDSNESLTCVIY